MSYIASTRMYDVAPGARQAWHRLFGRTLAKAGVPTTFIEHAWPQPIGDLWTRPGLALAFMCGWPFINALQEGRRFQILAGVAPCLPAYAGQARYRSEFLTREAAPYRTVEEALGSRYGWMVTDSQSGWSAPRRALARLIGPERPAPLFSVSQGPYGNPHNLLQALRDSEIDLTALDSWYLDLIRQHQPEKLTGIRTIGYTDWTPNPLLVAGPDVPSEIVARIRQALLHSHDDAATQQLMQEAYVQAFVDVHSSDYKVLLDHHTHALAAGYPAIV